MPDVYKPQHAAVGEPTLPGPAAEQLHVAIPDGASPTGAAAMIAAVEPTQVRRPWRSTVRTVFQSLVALAAMWGLVVETLGLDGLAWVGSSVVVAGAITRLMALPGIEAWLQDYLPWLSAAGAAPPSLRQRGDRGATVAEACLIVLAVVTALWFLFWLFGVHAH